MEMKKVLAWWNKVCPGCNIGRKYPESFIGQKIRNHWEKGCPFHNAYVEVETLSHLNQFVFTCQYSKSDLFTDIV